MFYFWITYYSLWLNIKIKYNICFRRPPRKLIKLLEGIQIIYEKNTLAIFVPMLIGYIRVSTDHHNLNLQKDKLIKYGVDERNIFSSKTSGSKDKRVGLDKAIEFLKEEDTLVVWKLDRLGRSLAHLISVINSLKNRNISFVSIN